MNSTNRALNRVVIAVIGAVLIGAGALSVLLAVDPRFASAWKDTTARLARPSSLTTAGIGGATWLELIVIAVALVLAVLLVVFIARQGRGHSATALRPHDGATSTRIDLAVPRALLEEHLAARDELAALRITAYEVRGTPMLKITARCRRGVSPAVVADLIGRAVGDLERIIGTDVPAFIQLTGGFSARGLRPGRTAQVAVRVR